LDHASPEQMKRMWLAMMARIQTYCADTGTLLPKWVRTESPDDVA
jgi:hypothetical protein